MGKFYRYLGFIVLFGLKFLTPSCNEKTLEPELFGSVKGIVETSEDQSPLEGVSITTNPGTSAVITNSDGEFQIGDVLVGDYAITAKKEGFTSATVNISVKQGKEEKVEIVLEIAPEEKTTPNVPVNLAPENKKNDLPIELELQWQGDDPPDDGDTLRYDVILYEGDDFGGVKVVENSLDTTFLLSGLKYNTAYRWRIVARNKSLEEAEGEIWAFKTQEFPNNRYFFVRDTNANPEIFSTDLSAINTIQLTYDPNRQIQPRLSPNRELIAFSSNREGNDHLFTMKKDGSDIFKVTLDIPIAGYHNNGIGFTWSPDGDYLVYSHYDKLYRINHDGTGLTQIATAPVNRHFRECHWSKYTNKIVALTIGVKAYDAEIYLMDPDGSNLFLLVDNLPGTVASPSFSVDGEKVIFTHDVSELEGDDGRQLDAHVFMIDLDGSNLTDLSGDKTNGTNDLQPRFSPDGAKIIFVNTSNTGEEQKDIWVMDANGDNRELLIANGEMPEWR